MRAMCGSECHQLLAGDLSRPLAPIELLPCYSLRRNTSPSRLSWSNSVGAEAGCSFYGRGSYTRKRGVVLGHEVDQKEAHEATLRAIYQDRSRGLVACLGTIGGR